MRHTIFHDERTIYLTYYDEIGIADAQELTHKTIDVITKSTSKHKYNFVLDISAAYITSIMSLKSTATLMRPYFNKMNNAYIVGAKGIQLTFAKMFIKFIGSIIKTGKIKFYQTIEEANIDIDKHWQRYIIKHRQHS